MHQPASPAEYNQGLLNEIFTTWAANTIEQDAGLDTIGFDFDVPVSPMRLEGQDGNDDSNDDQLVPLDHVIVPSSASQPPSLAMIAPATIASPTIEVRIPAFSEFTQQTNRRALIAHFTNVLSHLIVLREDEGNPFQRLVLPMSQQSPAVSNAIFALACAHLEHRGVHNSEKSVYFHNQAIHGLAALLAKGCGANRNEVLAAIILLIYYEVVGFNSKSTSISPNLTVFNS
jgi:hypothetical protein